MKGILFIEELFPKVVSGEKDMTRRMGGLKNINDGPNSRSSWWISVERFDDMSKYPNESIAKDYKKRKGTYFVFSGNGIGAIVKPRYQPGEILYLKEPYGAISGIMFYAYDYAKDAPMRKYFHGWRNKLFMPASLARYKIKITDVGAERAQDITEEDAIREGFENRAGLESAWIKINGISSWKPNPYCFVYEFKRV